MHGNLKLIFAAVATAATVFVAASQLYASRDAVDGLDKRLERVETKLDEVLERLPRR